MAVRSKVFTNDLGEPLTFNTVDCMCRGAVNFVIKNNGGRVVKDSSGPHTISLVASKKTRYWTSISSNKGGSTFSDTYIRDCIRNKKLLPLRKYWVNKDPDFDDRFDPNDIMLGAFTWASCKLPSQDRQPSHPQPPSSSSDKRKGEEDSQDISHLAESPLPDRVRKCAVLLERVKFPYKSNKADAPNTSEDPHQGASTSCDSDDNIDFYDWTSSWCGDHSEFEDGWFLRSRQWHGGFSAKIMGTRQPRVQKREEGSDSMWPDKYPSSSPTKSPQPMVVLERANVDFCLSLHEPDEVEVKEEEEEEEDLALKILIPSSFSLEQSHGEPTEDPLAIHPEQEPGVAEVEEQREAGGGSGGEDVNEDVPQVSEHPEASASSDSDVDCTPSGLELMVSAIEQSLKEQQGAICEGILPPCPLPVFAEENGCLERVDVSNDETAAGAPLARLTEQPQEEVEESLPPLTPTSCSPHTRPEQPQEELEESLPPLTPTSCSPHTRPREQPQEEIEESLPPLTPTSCSPHTRPEQPQEEIEESLPPLIPTSCSPHTRPREQPQEEIEESLPPLTPTSCSPHTRPEQPQEEVEESLPPLTPTSCSPHTRPEQPQEEIEESLPPLTPTCCSPHTRPEQPQEEIEESLPPLTPTSCSPHTRPEQPQEEVEESVASPHPQSDGRPSPTRPAEQMQEEVEDCRASPDHQDIEDSGSEATTVIFSVPQSPRKSDSCPSSPKKLKRRPVVWNGLLGELPQQNGRVSTFSDSSSSVLDQGRPRMNPRPRKQLRRKRGRHPGRKEEEEEEEDETEPIVRKVPVKHRWINTRFPRVQLARLPQNFTAEASSDSCTSNPRQRPQKKVKPRLRRLRKKKREVDKEEEEEEEKDEPIGEESSPAPPENQGEESRPVPPENQVEESSPAPPEDQEPVLVGPERSPSPQQEPGPSTQQGSGTESMYFKKGEERRVYPPKRRTRGDIAAANKKKEATKKRIPRQTSSRNGSSSASQKSQSSSASQDRQAKRDTTDSSSTSSCPLFRSPNRVTTERKGEYRVDEDMDILDYIANNKAYSRLGGRAFWQEMEQSFGCRRTWQSLKERFRMRILTNLKAYVPHGLDPGTIKELQGKMAIKKGTTRRGERHEFSYDEDLMIINFIVRNQRYCSVAGLMLWQEMEAKCPELSNHTWSSLKTRFTKKILPNIERYNLSQEEVLQFKNRRILKQEQKMMIEEKKKLPKYTVRKKRLARRTPRTKSPTTSTTHTEEEEEKEDCTDSPIAKSSLGKKTLRARSRQGNEEAGTSSGATTRAPPKRQHSPATPGQEERESDRSTPVARVSPRKTRGTEDPLEGSSTDSFGLNSPRTPANFRRRGKRPRHKQLTLEETMQLLNQNREKKRAAKKRSSPSDGDTNTPSTSHESGSSSTKPGRKRQLLTDYVMEMAPQTPFTRDSINRSLMRKRKTQLGKTGKGKQKVKRTAAGGGREEGESSQDEPSVKKRMVVVVAEVHNGRMEEDSHEEGEGTLNNAENASPTSAPLEEEEKGEEEEEKESEEKEKEVDDVIGNEEGEKGEEEVEELNLPLPGEEEVEELNVPLPEVNEETEEATEQEKQGTENGNSPEEEETSEEEEELEVYIHMNTPGMEGREMEGEYDTRQQTQEQKQATSKPNNPTEDEACMGINEEDDSLPDLNFTGDRESNEGGQGGEEGRERRSDPLQSPPQSPRPLPALHVITSRMSVKSPKNTKPIATGHPIFSTSLRKHFSNPPSPAPALSPYTCPALPNDCPSPCTVPLSCCPSPRTTPTAVQQSTSETLMASPVIRVRHYRRLRSHAHSPPICGPSNNVNIGTQPLPLANLRGTSLPQQNLPGAMQHKGTPVTPALPATASSPAQQSLPSTMQHKGTHVTASPPAQQGLSTPTQHKGTLVTVASPVASSPTLLLTSPTALPMSVHSNPSALPSTSPLLHNIHPLPVLIQPRSTTPLSLPNPCPLPVRDVIPLLQGSFGGTLPILQLNPSPPQHEGASLTLQDTPTASVVLCTPPTLHNSPTTLQPSQPRQHGTLSRILQPGSDTSDSLVDITSLPSRALESPERRTRLPEDVHPPSSSSTLSNRLRKRSIRM